MEFKVCDFQHFIQDTSHHWESHYQEVEMYQELFALNVNISYYQALEDVGRLLITVAYDNDKSVGYMVYVIQNHPKYKDNVCAIADCYWLHSDYRKKTTAMRMFQFTEGVLLAMGVNRLFANCKVDHPHGRFLLGMSYLHFEEAYTKLLVT